MTYWIQWREAGGRKGRRRGPFHHRQDAVRGIEEDMEVFAAQIEHGTGKRGWWIWDTADRAALWRDDMFHDEKPQGHYFIEQVTPEARTDDDDTDTA